MNEVPRIELNNGIRMPHIGLGVYTLPDDQTLTSVKAALESGYRLIDTAAVYGNEAAVGQAIAESDIPREDLFVTTKLWNNSQGYDKTMKAFEQSLTELGLDYVDLYLIHWPTPERHLFADTWKAFEDLYETGRVKAIGVSNFNPEHLDELKSTARVAPAVLQIELHPTFTQPELQMYAKEHSIIIESWYPLSGRPISAELLQRPELVQIATKYEKTPAQVVLRWHTQLGLVPLPGSSNPQHVAENIDIFDFSLTDDELAAISGFDTGHRLGPDPNSFNSA